MRPQQMTRRVIRVGCAGDNEKLIVRVYGSGSEHIIDRNKEMETFDILSRHGIAPRVHAKFKNGFVCGFLPGTSLDVDAVRETHVVRLICEKMAQMHRVPVDTRDESFLSHKLQQFLAHLVSRFKDADKQRAYDKHFGDVDFTQLVEQLNRILAAVNVRTQVLCHNDLLIYNIVHDETNDTVHFIDYEYTGVNYQLYDIANHFCEYAGVEELDYSRCPDEAHKRKFLNCYLTHYDGEAPDAAKLDAYLADVPKFEAASHLLWTTWALYQANNSQIDFDYLDYAAQRLVEYKRIAATLEAPAQNA